MHKSQKSALVAFPVKKMKLKKKLNAKAWLHNKYNVFFRLNTTRAFWQSRTCNPAFGGTCHCVD
jgi:hypothetical protein